MKYVRKIGGNTQHTLCIPKELADDGFIGDVDVLVNGVIATIIKPNATQKQIINSFRLSLAELKLRNK